ncbi:MAG: SDR family oxidoreductase [Oscillospiraceae bacterium]|nr:SDR family oxidoreductase [Oscillospiraceae bacterium]
MELEGKKIIVTGGGSGIAAGCVRGYVRAGADVVFCDVNDEGGKATEAEANAQEGVTGKATYIHCDISKQENVKEFFAKAIETLGGLDVLANIAGVERNKPAEDFVEDDIAFVMGVNFNGTVWTNQEAFKYFKANGVEGAIINYASDTGLSGMPNGAVYASSKAAVLGWTRSIAMDWAREASVRCNCVNPAIKTPMYKYWLETADPAVVEAYKAGLKQQFPLFGDMGEVDTDLVPVMVFLASDGARYINGQTICVNGGLVMVR